MNPHFFAYAIPGFSQPFSALSHLIAAGVMLSFGAFLILKGRGSQRVWLAIFVLSSVFLLSMSGVYHMLDFGTVAREEVFRRLDHGAIFVLIAGTITAAHGLLFTGFWRWGMISLLWLGAATAITLESVFFSSIPQILGLALYLGFGWLGLLSGYKLWRARGFRFISPVLWGGLAYTVGALADVMNYSPIEIHGILGAHDFFHLMVLVGLAWHSYFLWHLAGSNPG